MHFCWIFTQKPTPLPPNDALYLTKFFVHCSIIYQLYYALNKFVYIKKYVYIKEDIFLHIFCFCLHKIYYAYVGDRTPPPLQEMLKDICIFNGSSQDHHELHPQPQPQLQLEPHHHEIHPKGSCIKRDFRIKFFLLIRFIHLREHNINQTTRESRKNYYQIKKFFFFSVPYYTYNCWMAIKQNIPQLQPRLQPRLQPQSRLENQGHISPPGLPGKTHKKISGQPPPPLRTCLFLFLSLM